MLGRKWKILSEIKTKLTPSKVIDILLNNRGISSGEKEKFLNPRLETITLESVRIDRSEVEKTLKRIELAVKNNEKIIVYGDYDVDGICGSAILWESLFEYYKNVMPYIPHRTEEGYGLSKLGVDHIIKEHGRPGLIITVDNGIVAYDAVDYANSLGIDVIVTDHHVKGDRKVNAFAIVHTTNLCGAGVAYLLSIEIADKFKTTRNPNHLELAALATVADLVPLTEANRTIVKFGIQNLRKTNRTGILALIQETQINQARIGTYEIGHVIAPRLNATGRVAHALDSLRLICTKDPVRAKILAQHLSDTNKNRQLLTEESTRHADLLTSEIVADQKFIFVANADYNQGVIGLVASRLVEKHYRPTVVVAIGEKFSKGSARSVLGFNIIEFLRGHAEFLVDAGGHPMAAGFTIETSKIEDFKTALIKNSLQKVTAEMLARNLNIDLEINFSLIDFPFYDSIQELAPYGAANPEPLFLTRGAVVKNISYVGREKKHLKLLISNEKRQYEAIMFGVGATDLKIGDSIEVVYRIDRDEWDGKSKMVLKISDFKIS